MAKRPTPAGIRAFFTNRYLWLGLGLLVALIAVVYVLLNNVLMPSYTRQGEIVMVPDVRDQTVEEATRILAEHELEVERVVERFHPDLPRNVVIDQSPTPNSNVKPGRHIFLTVNAGRAQMVTVPTVENLSIREAENRLRALGLRVVNLLPDSIPSPYPNTITRQEPAPGDSLERGSGVSLWYSTGLGDLYVEIPNVAGMTVQEARAALEDLHLRPIVVGGEEDEDPADLEERTVVRQSREPGTRVREGYEIRIFVEEAEEQPDLQQL